MRAVVSAPDIFPHADSLLNVAEIHRGVRSEEGVTFNPNGCEVIFAHDSGCWVGDEKALQECNLAEFDAYVLELTMNIGTWMDMGDIRSHVEKAFAVGSSAVIERLMAVGIDPVAAGTNMTVPAINGAVSTNPIQGKQVATPNANQPLLTNATTVTPGADTPIGALGASEAKLVDASDHIGGAGTIMMSPIDAVQLPLNFDGNGTLRTMATGSKVIIGNYPPDTMYAVIGDVDVYLGTVEIEEAFNRAQNGQLVQAEMFAVAVWNTCAAFKHATA